MRALLAMIALALTVPAGARAVTVNFDDLPPNTVLTNQYASAGGAGQGVVFGPLPGGAGDGIRPRIEAPGPGVPSSDPHVASLANCTGSGSSCEFYIPNTTGTFQTPRSTVSVRVGLLGPPTGFTCLVGGTAPDCSVTTLTAYDAAGMVVGTPHSATLTQGKGVKTKLEVTAPSASIVGFRISQRDAEDTNKAIAIDDLTFATASGTPPPKPDFALTAQKTFSPIREGESIAVPIAIARFNGSSGPIDLAAAGMPEGVTAALDPDPAPADATTLTLTAAPGAPPTVESAPVVTVTGTPSSANAGPGARSTTVALQVKRAFELFAPAAATLDPCTVDVPIRVVRADGFTDPVELTVTGGGNGINAAVTGTMLTATGEATGRPTGPTTFTVTGRAAGLPERSAAVTVSGTCPRGYDARVTSMQVTQGVQSPVLPVRPPKSHSVASFDYDGIGTPARLVGERTTVVRVYANLRSGPVGGVEAVPAVLHGKRLNGFGYYETLPGSPLLPVGGPRRLTTGSASPTTGEQTSETSVYTFVLPRSWVENNNHIDVRANVLPAAQEPQINGTVAACEDLTCRINDTMEIRHVEFERMTPITIRPVRMYKAGETYFPDPADVFAYTQLTIPNPLRIEPYYGSIDINDIATSTAPDKTAAVDAALHEYMCDHSLPDPGWMVGVNTVDSGGQGDDRVCYAPPRSPKIAVVHYRRPLSSTGHEVGHLFDLEHASNGCYKADDDDPFVDWPPDQMGFTQSVGLDLRMGSGRFGGPFALMSQPGSTAFDLMSYCGDNAPVGDILKDPVFRDKWVSVRNWNQIIEDWQGFNDRSAPAPRQAREPVASLSVSGSVSGAEVSITGIAPVDAALQADAGEPYRLRGIDASGATVAEVPMRASALHVHGAVAPVALSGAVPAANVVKVAIARDDQVLAERAASATAPSVSVPAIPRFRRGRAALRWSASDADGDPLRVAVSYAADGKRFERVWMGSGDSVTLPAQFLPRGRAARLRVTVNDGFRSAMATSKPFRSPGAAPAVRIVSPLQGARQSADAALVLTGEAFADGGRSLEGSRLTWSAGGRVLGHGESIAAAGLPAGARRITLIARDRFGRSGRASVGVRVRAATPFLTVRRGAAQARTPRAVGEAARGGVSARPAAR